MSNSKGIIKVLNGKGLRVLEINSSFYEVNDFRPGDNNVPYHKLLGRDITDLVNKFSGIGIQDPEAVVQVVLTTPESDIQFHKDFKYIWYIR